MLSVIMTSFTQAMVILADEPAFRAAEDADERKFFFEEYMHTLQQAELDAVANARKNQVRVSVRARVTR
jgi:hypothetical protein